LAVPQARDQSTRSKEVGVNRAGRFSQQNLRGHVAFSSLEIGCYLDVALLVDIFSLALEDLSHTEITNFDGVIGRIYEDVVGLHVQVNDPIVVKVLQPSQDLLGNEPDDTLRKATETDELEKLATRHELNDAVSHLRLLA